MYEPRIRAVYYFGEAEGFVELRSVFVGYEKIDVDGVVEFRPKLFSSDTWGEMDEDQGTANFVRYLFEGEELTKDIKASYIEMAKKRREALKLTKTS